MNYSQFVRQEVAPTGGFPKVKFVSSNLTKKGLSSPAIFLTLGAITTFSTYLSKARIDRQRERLYEFAEMTSARNLVLSTLYGPVTTPAANSSLLPFRPLPKDPRIEPFINTVMARERELWVDEYRQLEASHAATAAAAAADASEQS